MKGSARGYRLCNGVIRLDEEEMFGKQFHLLGRL